MTAEPETDETVPLPQFQAGLYELVGELADHDVSRNVWDEEPPALWAVTGDRSPLGQVTLGVTEIPVSERVWRAAPPAQVLSTLVAALGPPPASLAVRVRAVMMAAESWELNYPEGATEEERHAATEFAQARGVADHPWGVEVKAVFAVDTDGWCYFATRRRSDSKGAGRVVPPGGDSDLGGSIPAALSALLLVLKGGHP